MDTAKPRVGRENGSAEAALGDLAAGTGGGLHRQGARDGLPLAGGDAFVFDSIGQSPTDVITLKRRAYDSSRIDVTRAKTGVTDAPIPLFPEAKKALDEYLAVQPPKLPDAPLFTNNRIGGQWNQSTLIKTHAKIRKAVGLPGYLQLQDFRTTVQTEGGAAFLAKTAIGG